MLLWIYNLMHGGFTTITVTIVYMLQKIDIKGNSLHSIYTRVIELNESLGTNQRCKKKEVKMYFLFSED